MEDPLNGPKYTLEIAHQGSSTLIGQSVGLRRIVISSASVRVSHALANRGLHSPHGDRLRFPV